MKKIIIPSVIIATIASIGTSVFAANQTYEKSTDIIAATSQAAVLTSAATNPLSSKDETVYVIANSDGTAKQTFIGSTLNTGSETLPVNLHVSYRLDNQDISAANLAGKSGRVQITFSYESVATYQNQYVPFLAVSGVLLDQAKFQGITVDHGKIVSDGSRTAVIGFGLPGLNADLGTDFFPDSFTITASVTNFELGTTYTLISNDIIKDIDTAKFTDLDSIIGSINDLSAGLDRIVSGAANLDDGLTTILDGTKSIYAGSKTLATSIKNASDGANALSNGLNTITSNNAAIQTGANTVIDTLLEKSNSVLHLLQSFGLSFDFDEINLNNYATVYTELKDQINTYLTDFLTQYNLPAEQQTIITSLVNTILNVLTSLKDLIDLNVGVIQYTDGVATAASGASELASGLSALSSGADALSNKLGLLIDGESKLKDGSATLKDGLATFKTAGIDKLESFVNQDLNSFVYNARKAIDAARSYTHFKNPVAKSVKFIVKTASIK